MNYLDALGAKIRSHVPPSHLPEEDTHALFRLYAVLMLAKGSRVTLEDVHNAWVAWKIDTDPLHESLVPYSELPSSVAEEDQPYANAIRLAAEGSL